MENQEALLLLHASRIAPDLVVAVEAISTQMRVCSASCLQVLSPITPCHIADLKGEQTGDRSEGRDASLSFGLLCPGTKIKNYTSPRARWSHSRATRQKNQAAYFVQVYQVEGMQVCTISYLQELSTTWHGRSAAPPEEAELSATQTPSATENPEL